MRSRTCVAQRRHVVPVVRPVGAHRLEHADLGVGDAEAPVVLAQGGCGCRARRAGGSAPGRRWPAGTRPSLNGGQLAAGRAGALREDHHRHVRVEPPPALRHRLGDAVAVAAHERDVAGQPHQPADGGDAEERRLRQPLHLPRQVGDEQDVDEALVVGDDDVRPAGVGRQLADDAEAPQRVERLVDDGEAAEQPAGGVATAVERHRDQPHDGDERQPDGQQRRRARASSRR